MQTIADILGYTPIDSHSHFDHGVEGDLYSIASPAGRECHRITLDFLRNRYDSVGIGPACFSTYASVSSNRHILEENRYLHQLAQENDQVYQWIVVEPRQPQTFDQAAEMLKSRKTIGIKAQKFYIIGDIRGKLSVDPVILRTAVVNIEGVAFRIGI